MTDQRAAGRPSGARPPDAHALPGITLPKSGGAIRGIGETFTASGPTGTGATTVPIPTSAGRGFAPQLTLSYNSGSGNGPFGFGWTLGLPAITRRTDRGLPRYLDEQESDVFLLSGAEDLVPLVDATGARIVDRTTAPGFTIHRYRPRVEGLFARIERWTAAGGDVHWRSISRENVVSIYGPDGRSRIADPVDGRRVFSWLIAYSLDDRGNVVVYDYAAEDGRGVDVTLAHERNRGSRTDPRRTANRYPKRIRYGNRRSAVASGARPRLLDDAWIDAADWMFEVVFDYGEHAASDPTPAAGGEWRPRADAFSSYRAGFEVRTSRLCERVLMFHHFDGEPNVGRNCLVRSTDFTYSHGTDPAQPPSPVYTFLIEVHQKGYTRKGSGYVEAALPPVAFGYAQPRIGRDVRTLAPDTLEHLPAGLGAGYLWTDLHGEGTPGVVAAHGGAWTYKRNLSPMYAEARFGALETVRTAPAQPLEGGAARFVDLAGDGRPDLVAFDGAVAGLYEHDDAESWRPFRPFPSRLSRNTRDPNLRFVDLDGDGHADVLITEHDALVWHQSLGEDGFGPERRVRRELDEERGPRVVFADGTESTFLADLCGDGLSDLVRIRNGEICYWPNLGYGRFGAKVTMDGAPRFDTPDAFDPRRIRLADVDGSGTTDLIYLHRSGPRIYFNQSGNSWSAAEALPAFPGLDSATDVEAMDLLGHGTACLVWSSPLPGDARRQMRYVDLMGGTKPHLLVSTKNNLGAETTIAYAPSTRYYLEDRQNGRPWGTRLPFPVHVVSSVEVRDATTDSRLVSRFAYHDGRFDGVEREFAGFGEIERWDAEEFSASGSRVPPALTRTWFHTGAAVSTDASSRYFAAADSALPPTLLSHGLTADEERQAHRALKGAMLRSELYADDGTAAAAVPYQVTAQAFAVQCLQRSTASTDPVFVSHTREALTLHYERRAADPRVRHTLTIDVDRYGNVRREVAVAYGRAASPLPDAWDADRQTRTIVTCTERTFTNAVDDLAGLPDDHRSPAIAGARTYEVTGVAPASGGRFTADEWARNGFALFASLAEIGYGQPSTPGQQQKRLIEHTRTRYRRNDLAGLLPLGQLESRALAGQAYTLALTPALVADVFRRPVTGQPDEVLVPAAAALLESTGPDGGGYIAWDGGWWVPSRRLFFDPAANPADPVATAASELARAQDHFFLVRLGADPFHQTTVVDYDAHDLLVTSSRDAADNLVSAQGDYRVLQPSLITDANGNRTAIAFDALGLQVATAVMGKTTEQLGDRLQGFTPDPALAVVQAFVAQPHAHARAMIGDATTRTVYDLHRYARCGQPPFSATLTREVHATDPDAANGRILVSFVYSDGFGREVQRKVPAEAGDAPARQAAAALASGDVAPGDLLLAAGATIPAPAAPRWVGSGRTLFDNKGNAIKRYEPFFSSTHLYETEAEMTEAGVSSRLLYDPLGRVVGTLHPNHTYEKVVFDAWEQTTYDVNDTVLVDPADDEDVRAWLVGPDGSPRIPASEYSPPWHAKAAASPDAAERNAAQKAAAHADTPTIAHFDALGRAFLTIADNGPSPTQPAARVSLASRVELDVEGNQLAIRDAVQQTSPLGRVVQRQRHDLSGGVLRTANLDAGERWMLRDVAGNVIRSWSTRGFMRRLTYDALRRITGVYVAEAGVERLAERTVYGEPQGAAANHRTRVFQVLDAAGIVTSDKYDFKGNLRVSRRELLSGYQTAVNWSGSPAAGGGTFTSQTTYDALNRPVDLTSPDGNVLTLAYNDAGFMEAVALRRAGAAAGAPMVSAIAYDAKGRRTSITYGNGATTTYAYEPLTFRLARLRTTRPVPAGGLGAQLFADPGVVQDLRYTYDPAGNITRVADLAAKTVVHGGQTVTAAADYTYDPIGRLIAASGREHVGQAALAYATSNRRDFPFAGAGAHPHDLSALRTYAQSFEYDAAGNPLLVRHVAQGGGWTRSFSYAEPSFTEPAATGNRVTMSSVGNGATWSEPFTYDAHGCVTSMAHLPSLAWDVEDQLTRVDLGAGRTAFYVYDASGQRVRKIIQAAGGQPQQEHLYFGAFEIRRDFLPGGAIDHQRESLHVLDDTRRIAMVDTDTVVGGAPVAAPVPAVRFQLGNHLGSATLELADDGALIGYEEYHPFGTTAFQAGRSAAEASLKRYRYAGKERDEETGLDYYGARYYAPWLTRWTACDPAGMVDGPNLYAFVRNNPIRAVDRGGLATEHAPGVPYSPMTGQAYPNTNIDPRTGYFLLRRVVTEYDALFEAFPGAGHPPEHGLTESGRLVRGNPGSIPQALVGDEGLLMHTHPMGKWPGAADVVNNMMKHGMSEHVIVHPEGTTYVRIDPKTGVGFASNMPKNGGPVEVQYINQDAPKGMPKGGRMDIDVSKGPSSGNVTEDPAVGGKSKGKKPSGEGKGAKARTRTKAPKATTGSAPPAPSGAPPKPSLGARAVDVGGKVLKGGGAVLAVGGSLSGGWQVGTGVTKMAEGDVAHGAIDVAEGSANLGLTIGVPAAVQSGAIVAEGGLAAGALTAAAGVAAAGSVLLVAETARAAVNGEETPIDVADKFYGTHFGDIVGWIRGDYSD